MQWYNYIKVKSKELICHPVMQVLFLSKNICEICDKRMFSDFVIRFKILVFYSTVTICYIEICCFFRSNLITYFGT